MGSHLDGDGLLCMGSVQGVTCDDCGTDDLLCMGSAECYVDTSMIGMLGTGSTTCNGVIDDVI